MSRRTNLTFMDVAVGNQVVESLASKLAPYITVVRTLGGDSMNRGVLLPILVIGVMLMSTLPLATGGPIQDGHPWSEATPGGSVPDNPRPGPTGPFIENLGQWEDHVRFVARTAFGEVVFHRDGDMYSTRGSGGGHDVKVEFHNARSVEPVGIGDTGTVFNYMYGNDPVGIAGDSSGPDVRRRCPRSDEGQGWHTGPGHPIGRLPHVQA